MRLFRFAAVGIAILCWTTAALVGAAANVSPVSETIPATQLTATLELRRIPGDARLIAIAVANHGSAPVTVTGAELATDSLTSTGLLPVEVTVPGNAIRDVFIEYGSGICHGDLSPTAEPATSRLLLDNQQRIDIALPHPEGTLDRLLATDCAAAFLTETASIAFQNWDATPDGRLRADLVITRTAGNQPFRLDRMSGNPHYELAAAAPPSAGDAIALIDGDEAHMAVPVIVQVSCDAHGLAEAKQPFRFPIWLTVGTHQAIPTVIPVTDSDIAHLESLRDLQCA